MPRAAMPAPFPPSDLSGEVVCPLQNQDGSTCRKRCLGVSSFFSSLCAFFALCFPAASHPPALSLVVPTCGLACRPLLIAPFWMHQDKRYRSMQEHIRRAHPDYYIPKLPATEESFYLMVNTPADGAPRATDATALASDWSVFASGHGANIVTSSVSSGPPPHIPE